MNFEAAYRRIHNFYSGVIFVVQQQINLKELSLNKMHNIKYCIRYFHAEMYLSSEFS